MKTDLSSTTSSPYFIGILSLLLGLVMIIWPEQIVSFVVIIIGWFLVLTGAIPIIINLIKKYPISFVSVIYLIAGIFILIFNHALVNLIMWIFGIILILAAVQQFNMYAASKKLGYKIHNYAYIYPAVLLLGGVITLINPFGSLSTLVIFFGCFLLFFGITMLISKSAMQKIAK